MSLSEQQVLECLYNGVDINKLDIEQDFLVQINTSLKVLNVRELKKPIFTKKYLMPLEYENIDIFQYFANKVNTDEEKYRVAIELKLFIDTNSVSMLKYCIYLADVIRENNIITGVGRGSSVSLYVLYLCGLHRVDSLKYNLSPYDFFKEKI